jgi:hypothetical protein
MTRTRLPIFAVLVAATILSARPAFRGTAARLFPVQHRRRARVYAGVNPKVAYGLLSAVEARAKTATPDAALSMFDLGYLVETYRQAALVFRGGVLPSVDGIDGYGLVQKAAAFRHDPQIEFAAAVITASLWRPEYAAHLRNAEAASKADTLLASNLTTRFPQP